MSRLRRSKRLLHPRMALVQMQDKGPRFQRQLIDCANVQISDAALAEIKLELAGQKPQPGIVVLVRGEQIGPGRVELAASSFVQQLFNQELVVAVVLDL